MRLAAILFALVLARPALGQDKYGAKNIFPVYEGDGKWWIYEKGGKQAALKTGGTFLVIGSEGSGLFGVVRSSAAYGGQCDGRKMKKLRTAILLGDRRAPRIGTPIIGIKAPDGFSLKGSKARYEALKNQVTEQTYQLLLPALKAAAIQEIKSGIFRFKSDDSPSPQLLNEPREEQVGLKIDFGAPLRIAGLKAPFILVTGAQVSATYRRCVRLADGDKLIGDCLEMPDALLAETSRLQFVSYDPSGKGNVYLLAYTPQEPLWGHERWGFAVNKGGVRLFLMDAMDPKCRETF
jgi:hypothetical protein